VVWEKKYGSSEDERTAADRFTAMFIGKLSYLR